MNSPSITTIPNLTYLTRTNVLANPNFRPGSWAIYHPEVISATDLAQLRKKIDTDKYFVQLGYLASSILLPRASAEIRARLDISLEAPADADELSSLLGETFDLYFAKTWNAQVPDSFLEACRKLLTEAIGVTDAAVIKCNGQVKGVVTVSPQVDCMGVEVLQIPWVWVDSELNTSERQTIHSLIIKWLQSKNVMGHPYKAGIHLFNERSQGFFAKLGFTLRCAHILKR